jgi:RNA polymerase sigma factor (sigma-70 family)
MQGRREAVAEDRVAAVMAEHGRALLRVAHRWSLCHDDAMDAYQRALEIFLRRIDTVEPATEAAWLKVVVKHEALAIRRSRSSSMQADDVDPDWVPSPQRSAEEVVAGDERVKRSAEALRALKPDEARALMLKAEGLSYAEIGERCGWSYTKVNRAITEGRRRFLEVFRAIESGDACERFAGTLAALAGGTASSEEILEIRPHLRHCMACRATVRELHMSKRAELQLWVPAALVGPLGWLTAGRSSTGLGQLVTPADLPDSHEPARPGRIREFATDLLAPADLPDTTEPARPGRIREFATDLVTRANSSDVATGIHIISANATGGGRLATVATILGLCFSSIGAGAICVATGVVEAPGWIMGREVRAAPPKPASRLARPPRKRHTEVTRTSRVAELLRTPTPTPAPPLAKPRRVSVHEPRRSAKSDPSQGTAPDSHESAPIADTSRSSTPDFSIEQSSEPKSSTNADPAPLTGGDEFTP